MSLLSQIRRALQTPTPATPTPRVTLPDAGSQADYDQRAIERYRYLLRTASPDHLEQVHAEAFATLTPDQRHQVLDGLGTDTAMTDAHRQALVDDPKALAREATRSEIRQPGTMERVLGGTGGTGRALAGGLLAGVAGAVVGSVVIDGLVDTGFGDGGLFGGGPDTPWAGGLDGPGFGGMDIGGWFD